MNRLFFKRVFVKNKHSQSLLSRKNDLALRIALIFVVFAIPYVVIFGYLHMGDIQAMVIATIGFLGLSIFFNKIKWHSISKALLVIGPTLTFFGSANVLGPGAGAQFLLFALVPLPLLLFDLTQTGWVLLCVLAPLTASILLELGQYQWLSHGEYLDQNTLLYIRCFVIITTFLLLVLSAGAYFISNRRYELAVERKNKELESKNSTIEAHLKEMERVTEELKAKADMDKQIDRAKEIQESILPRNIPSFENYHLDKLFLPAKQVSGDYYYFFSLTASKVGIVIADIVGKGIPASLMMIDFKGLMRNAISPKIGPSQTFAQLTDIVFLNQVLANPVPAIYGILDTKANTFTYCNAGHEPALLFSGSQIKELRIGGAALGFNEANHYEEEVIKLKPNDRLVLFTDGLTDIKNKEGKRLGVNSMTELFSCWNTTPDKNFVEEIDRAIQDYSEGEDQADDITMVTIQRLSPKE